MRNIWFRETEGNIIGETPFVAALLSWDFSSTRLAEERQQHWTPPS